MKTKEAFHHLEPRRIGMNLSLLVLCFVSMLLCSCQKNSDDASSTDTTDNIENWAEYFFDERLASISADVDNGQFYISTEDGSIYQFNNESGIVKYDTPFNRIYCVKRDQHDPACYWVGTRNMGLKRCLLKGDSLVLQQSYSIPVKGDRYSVYDMCYNNDTLYLGTSNGLFCKLANGASSGNSELKMCWMKGHLGDPVVVRKLCYDGGCLFFTTEKGLSKRKNGQNYTVIPDTEEVTFYPSLWKSNDSVGVKAIINNTLYTITGEKIVSTAVDHMCMDFLQANDNLYQASKDSLFVNGVGRLLPSPARQECRNLIADDPAHDQVLLVTSHHLLRIPHHYILPTWAYNHVSVSASCTDEKGNAFFLLGDKLFELKQGDTIANEKFSCQYLPSMMTVCDGKFYFVHNGQLQCLNDKGNIERSHFLTKEATALGSHDNIVYIGVRDNILMLKDEHLSEVKLLDENDSLVPFPFITAFSNCSDGLYIATLNDGVFKGKGSEFKRVAELSDESTHRFIRDIACKGDTTFVLTHKQLWVHTPQGTFPPIYSPGFNRLLVSGPNVVAVADFGLREFTIGENAISFAGDYYQDWSFRPEKSLDCGGRMIVCRNNGVLLIDDSIGKADKHHWIEFKPNWQFDSNWKLVLMCAAIALLLLLLMSWLMRRRHKQDLQTKEEESQMIINLRNRLRRQLDAIRSYGLSDYETIKRQADKVYELNDVAQFEKITQSNKEIIDAVAKVKAWQQTWVAGRGQMYLSEDLVNETKKLDSFLNTHSKLKPIECDKRVDDFLDYAANDSVREPFEQHLEEQLAAIQQVMAVSKACGLPVADVLAAQQKEYQAILKQFNDRLTEDEMVNLLKQIKTLDDRHKMARGIVDLGQCLYNAVHAPEGEDDSLFDLIEENQDQLNGNDPYFVRLRSKLKDLATTAFSAIQAIYEPWIGGSEVDNHLLELIKTGSTTGKLFGKSKDANIIQRGAFVALLLTGVELSTNNMKILIDTMFGKREGDYKKDKSEVKTHLQGQREQLEDYAKDNPSSIARLLL